MAGLGAGATEATFVTTPQETIKIKLIDDQFSRAVPQYRNFFHGIKTIVGESGFGGWVKSCLICNHFVMRGNTFESWDKSTYL